MKISAKQYAQAIIGSVEGVSPEKGRVFFDNFLKIVEENNDGKMLPGIIGEVERLNEKKAGSRKATITTALAISDETKKDIKKKLEDSFKAKIILKQLVDPNILGGIVIETDNEILDASMRTWLDKFKHELI